jgi:hypothetical protein
MTAVNVAWLVWIKSLNSVLLLHMDTVSIIMRAAALWVYLTPLFRLLRFYRSLDHWNFCCLLNCSFWFQWFNFDFDLDLFRNPSVLLNRVSVYIGQKIICKLLFHLAWWLLIRRILIFRGLIEVYHYIRDILILEWLDLLRLFSQIYWALIHSYLLWRSLLAFFLWFNG